MTHYDVLEVSENASQEVIQMAYKALVKKYHPDVNKGFEEKAEAKLKSINRAYGVLSNPERRKRYDAYLKQKATEHSKEKRTEADEVIFEKRESASHTEHQESREESDLTYLTRVAAVAENNAQYFFDVFKRIKITNGTVSKLNWPAFFLGYAYPFYRRCGKLSKKYYFASIIIGVIFSITLASYSIEPNESTYTSSAFFLVLFLVSILISNIVLGVRFNEEYLSHCEEQLHSQFPKRGTSLGAYFAVVFTVTLAWYVMGIVMQLVILAIYVANYT